MNSSKTTDKLARQLASIRHRKIKKIKSKISSGTYAVNNKALAKALFLSQ